MYNYTEDLKEAWMVNHRVNTRIITSLDEEALNFTTSSRGGNTPLKQFAHMQNVRISHLELKLRTAKALPLKKFSLKEPLDREEIRLAMDDSSNGVLLLIEQAAEEFALKGYKRGIGVFLSYLISHEAHHRGKMFHILKAGKFKLDTKLSHGIWDWGRI